MTGLTDRNLLQLRRGLLNVQSCVVDDRVGMRAKLGTMVVFEWEGQALSAGLRALGMELVRMANQAERIESQELDEQRCELCGHWFSKLEIEAGSTHDCDGES